VNLFTSHCTVNGKQHPCCKQQLTVQWLVNKFTGSVLHGIGNASLLSDSSKWSSWQPPS